MPTTLAFRASPSPPRPLSIQEWEPSKPETDDDDVQSKPKPKQKQKPADVIESVPPQRATRAWKVVDAKAILSKRKYTKRQTKAQSVSESSDASQHEKKVVDDELATANQTRSLSWPSPESDVRSGGLRGDPFASFPDNSTSVQGAIDFLIKEIGSNAVPGTIHKSGFSPKASAFMHYGFEHELVFHAVVAFALGYDEVANTGTTDPSQAVLYHRGKATQGLYARLKDPSTCADDAAILTTFLLVDNVWRYGENAIGQAHYAGLMKMIEMRGGLDRLGMNGVLRSIIEFAEVTDIGDAMRSPTAPALPDLRYYHHPFPPQICGLIAKLPDGYAEIAMQGHLSIETMSTLVWLREWLNTDPAERSPAPHKQIGAGRRCMAASKSATGNPIEEAVCFGIVLTGMRSFHARFSRMDHSFIDRVVELSEDFDRSPKIKGNRRTVEREHIAYLTMVAVEASDRCIELQGHVHKLVDLLIEREKFASSWAGMERVMKRFFWIDFAVDRWKGCWSKHLKRREEEKAKAKARAARSSDAAIWEAMKAGSG